MMQLPAGASPRLETPRLVLLAPDPAMAPEVLEFFVANREHFAPWDPPTPEILLTLKFQRERLLHGERAFAAGESFRYWLRLRSEPPRLVGQIHFSNVVRGAFHSAMLGYQIDRAAQRRGLMTEALQAGIAEMFSPRVNLHRIQANHMPQNARSAAVLTRLKFVREGLARRYLFVDGNWRDHVMTALLNPVYAGPPLF